MFPNLQMYILILNIIIITREIIIIITIMMITVQITSVQTFQQPFAKRAPVAGTVATAHKPDEDDGDESYEDN